MAESEVFDRPPKAGLLDLTDPETASQEGPEISTEPTSEELAADLAGVAAPAPAAAPAVSWPSDNGSPEYRHLTDIQAPTAFSLTAEDVETLIAANRFQPEGRENVIALAIRGSVLQAPHEKIKESSIAVSDVRPTHKDFRCTLGYYYRGTGKLTLFTGSTVPAPKYMKTQLNGGQNCNLLPTGCYVFRVARHKNITPALRMTDPDDMHSDAEVTVLRTEDDLSYGFGANDRWDKSMPFDNVHCSFFLDFSPTFGAPFSSAGCLTVRGLKTPSNQWKKFQDQLDDLGLGKRCDLMLLTGREFAIAAKLRADGLLGDETTVRRELVRLRCGSHGDEVKRLQQKLGFANPTGYFGPATKKQLADHQKANGIPADGIFSPELDNQLDWEVFGGTTA